MTTASSSASNLTDRLAAMSSERRGYALDSMAYHLSYGGRSDELYRLIGRAWRDVQFEHTMTNAAFTRDVELAMHAAVERFPRDLGNMWRTALLRSLLDDTSSQITPGLVRLLVRLGRSQQGLALARAIAAPEERARSFTYAAEALLDACEGEAALLPLRDALAAATLIDPIVPQVDAFESIAEVALRAGDEPMLQQALERLEACELGHWSENALVRLARCTDRSDVLLRVLTLARRFDTDDYDLKGTRFSVLAALAPALVRAGMTETVRALRADALQLGEVLYQAQLLATLVRALANCNDRDGVDSVATIAREQITGEGSGYLIGAVAFAYDHLGCHAEYGTALREALANLQTVESGRNRDMAARRIGVLLAEAGDIAEAMKVIETIEKAQERSDALVAVGRALLERGDTEQAQRVAEEAMETARIVDDYEEMYAPYGPVAAVIEAAKLLWAVGLHAESLQAVHEMLRFGSYLCDSAYGPDALEGAMEVIVAADDAEAMEQVLSLAVALQDSTFRDMATYAVVKSLVGMRLFDRAIEVMETCDVVDVVLVAEGLRVAGDRRRSEELAERALADARRVSGSNEQAGTFVTVANELLSQGSDRAAREVAEEALRAANAMVASSLAQDIFANGDQAVSLARIAATMLRGGDAASALQIARQAWNVSNPAAPAKRSSVSPEGWKSGVAIWGQQRTVLNEIAPVFVGAGLYGDLFEMACGAKGAEISDIAAETVEGLRRAGHDFWADSALAKLRGMLGERDEPSGRRLRGVLARLYAGSGRFDEALHMVAGDADAGARQSALTAMIEHASAAIPVSVLERALANGGESDASDAGVRFLCASACAFARYGLVPKAVGLSAKAYDVARTLAERAERTMALARCAETEARLERLGLAEAIANEAVATAPADYGVLEGWSVLFAAFHLLPVKSSVNPALVAVAALPDRENGAAVLSMLLREKQTAGDGASIAYLLERLRERWSGARRAAVLADAAHAYFRAGLSEEALPVWQEACITAREFGLSAVFRALERGAGLVATIDRGATLFAMYEDTMDVLHW